MRNEPGFVPYDIRGHRVDRDSQDFRNVMAWLREHGAPDPEFVSIVYAAGITADTSPQPDLGLLYNGNWSQLMHAYNVMNAPNSVLATLGLPGAEHNYAPPAPPPLPTLPTGAKPRIAGPSPDGSQYGGLPAYPKNEEPANDGAELIVHDGDFPEVPAGKYKLRKWIFGNSWFKIA